MEMYYIVIDWKNGEITEGYHVAENKEKAIEKSLYGCDSKDDILGIEVFKRIKGVKW